MSGFHVRQHRAERSSARAFLQLASPSIGVIAYLSATALVPLQAILLTLPIAGTRAAVSIRVSRKFRLADTLSVATLLAGVAWSTVLFLFANPVAVEESRSLLGNFPYLLLVCASLFVATQVNRADLRAIVVLAAIEALFGLLAWVMGTHSVLPIAYASQREFGADGLLYYARSYGLSENSSVFAYKVAIGLFALLLKPQLFRSASRWVLIVVLALGLFVSFNRTTLAAVAVFVVVLILSRKRLRWAVIPVILVTLIFAAFPSDQVEGQIFRDRGFADLEQRFEIYAAFVRAIESQPHIGNAGAKLWLTIGDRVYHAHNSFVQTLVSNGVVGGGLFLLGYVALVFRRSPALGAGVLALGSFQYFVLWGLSFYDIAIAGLALSSFGASASSTAARHRQGVER